MRRPAALVVLVLAAGSALLAGCTFAQTAHFWQAPGGAFNAVLNALALVGIALLVLDARRRDARRDRDRTR